LQTEIQ
jgi:hypothetical protein